MGLAGPKNRTKISNDPNNTKWTNDKESFGLKLMTSQGWKPGEYLGAVDAKQAEFHTAANASHIRVSIKDDNLGLGAKIGNGVGHGECTGLDAFKNLLGRLNGKDEDEVEKEQKSREDLRRAIYTERKWGSIRFVTGGFLIGDKIQQLIETEAERIRKIEAGETNTESSNSSESSSEAEEEEEEETSAPVERSKKSKNRKTEVNEEETLVPVEKNRKSKKRKIEALEEDEREIVSTKAKKSKRKAQTSSDDTEGATPAEGDEKSSKKKSKKDRKPTVEEGGIGSEKELKKLRKKEKKHKKGHKEKSHSDPEGSGNVPKKEKKSKRDKEKSVPDLVPDSSESSQHSTKESTPATPLPIESGRSTPMMSGRHAVRSRYIAQKRLASMDVASLNQIFMIKS